MAQAECRVPRSSSPFVLHTNGHRLAQHGCICSLNVSCLADQLLYTLCAPLKKKKGGGGGVLAFNNGSIVKPKEAKPTKEQPENNQRRFFVDRLYNSVIMLKMDYNKGQVREIFNYFDVL